MPRLCFLGRRRRSKVLKVRAECGLWGFSLRTVGSQMLLEQYTEAISFGDLT